VKKGSRTQIWRWRYYKNIGLEAMSRENIVMIRDATKEK
jgi:hypothetical protein